MLAVRSVSASEAERRITIALDPSIPIDRLMLGRLTPMKARTRQAWLRGLLAEGFLLECRMLQLMREGRSEVAAPKLNSTFPITAFHPPVASRRSTGNDTVATPTPVPSNDSSSHARPDEKPFAHLRRVIG